MGKLDDYLDAKPSAPASGSKLDAYLDAKPQKAKGSTGDNIGAGLIEGATGLLDMGNAAVSAFTPAGMWAKKTFPNNPFFEGVGPAITKGLGLAPDRDSFGYHAANIAGGGLTGRGGVNAGKAAMEGKAALPFIKENLAPMAKGTVANTLAGIFGAGAGEVGEAVGGDTGRAVGEIAGSIAAPVGLRKGVNTLARSQFGAGEKSTEVLNAVDRLNSRLPDDDKIPLTAGLLGNKTAQYLENFSGILPLIGGKVHDIQGRQLGGWSRGVDFIGGELPTTTPLVEPKPKTWNVSRPGDDFPQAFTNPSWNESQTLARPELKGDDPAKLGAQIRDIANYNFNTKTGDITAGEDALSWAIGSRSDVPTGNVDPVIDRLKKSAARDQNTALDKEQGDLHWLRGRTDTAIELNRKISALPLGSPERKIAEDELKDYLGQRNISFDQLRNQRTGVGRRTNYPSLDGAQVKPVYEAMTDSLQGAADKAGVRPQWDTLQAMEAEWYRKNGNLTNRDGAFVEQPSIIDSHDGTIEDIARRQETKALLNSKTDIDAYNWLHSGGNAVPHERFEYLADASGGAGSPKFRQLAGDYYRGLGRPSAGGTTPRGDYLPMSTSTDVDGNPVQSFTQPGMKDPIRFSTETRKLDERTKDLFANYSPEVRGDMDAAEAISLAMKERGKAGNPSGSTIMAIPAATLGNPLRAVTSGVPAFFLRNKILDENFARSLGDRSVSDFRPMEKGDYAGRMAAILTGALRGN